MFTRGTQEFLFFFLTYILQGTFTEATCFIPPEYTGEFVMQKSVNTGGTVQYSPINITFLGTPLWGSCLERSDNNFIFTLSDADNPCLKCLNLNLKSKNVLQVSSMNFKHCHPEKSDAINSCPKENAKNIDEIILFKIAEISRYPSQKEFCPLGDRYSLIYNTVNPNKPSCMKYDGVLSTCSSGAVMDLEFNNCNGTDFKLACIGQWVGANGQKYLALEDTRKKPTYRCALYEQNTETGVIHMALSKDSTCDVELQSATIGYETLILKPNTVEEARSWDDTKNSDCRFPDWLQGKWEHVNVENNKFFYKDHSDFITYDLKCLSQLVKDKYIVHSRTHCNERHYNCLWIQQRSDNVFEFQLGAKSSKYKTEHVCDPSNRNIDKWITQSRKSPTSPIKCPISGVFKGKIPEANSFCSNLSSDCKTPDLMYYKVFNCDTMDLFEEREYRCLGHWKEDDLLYTYTKRVDKIAEGTFECFVGSIVSDKEDYIIIKEAGEHCQRNMDALVSGMKLTKQKQLPVLCVGGDANNDNNIKNTYWTVDESNTTQNQSNSIDNHTYNIQKVNPQTGGSNLQNPIGLTISIISMIVIFLN